MPELPEVEQVRRTLVPFLVGVRIDEVELRRANLRTAFTPRFATRLAGQRVEALDRRGKYLLATLSSGETLVMHLGMSGEFRVEVPRRGRAGLGPDRVEPDRHDHVVFRLDSGAVITFNDQRRFGFMDVVPAGALGRHPALRAMGPEPLSADFDAAALARGLRRRTTSIKAALLDQRVVAGVGNIYASEALHRAGVSPLRRASALTTPAGAARLAAVRLTAAIRDVLTRAIVRASDATDRDGAFRVYDRGGEPCVRRGCGGTIRRLVQAGRSTYYCPRCQR